MIEFVCSISRIKTMCDGGIRLELDLPETSDVVVPQLLECRRQALKVIMQPVDK